MAKFNLYCAVTVSAYTTVEADTLEAAIEIAEERQVVIGGVQSAADSNSEWIIDEADGEPQDIHGSI